MSSVSLSVNPSGLLVSSALAPQQGVSVSSSDLSRFSLSPEPERVQNQARRDLAIQKFVQRNGLVCRGDIAVLIQREAERLVTNRLFQSEDEAETAIFNAYKRYVRQQPREEVNKAITALQSPRVAMALIEDRAQRPVLEARQKWLAVHQELQRRFGIEGTEPEWRKTAEAIARNLGHNDAYNLRGLLEEERAALQQLQAAEKRRNEPVPDMEAHVARVAGEAKKFALFLRACRGDFKREMFVRNRVEFFQRKKQALRKAHFELYAKGNGMNHPVNLAIVELDEAIKRKNELSDRVLEFFGEADGDQLIECAQEPNEKNRNRAEQICSSHENQEVARDTYVQFVRAVETVSSIKANLDQLEQEHQRIRKGEREVWARIGCYVEPVRYALERQALVLEKHVDLEDEAAVEEFLQWAEQELCALQTAQEQNTEKLHDITVALTTMRAAEAQILDGLVYKTPTKEDDEVYADLQKRLQDAELKKQELLKEFVALDANILEKEQILATGRYALFGCRKDATIDTLQIQLELIQCVLQRYIPRLKDPQAEELCSDEDLDLLQVIGKTAKLRGYRDPEECLRDLKLRDNRELISCFEFQLAIDAQVLEAQIAALSVPGEKTLRQKIADNRDRNYANNVERRALTAKLGDLERLKKPSKEEERELAFVFQRLKETRLEKKRLRKEYLALLAEEDKY